MLGPVNVDVFSMLTGTQMIKCDGLNCRSLDTMSKGGWQARAHLPSHHTIYDTHSFDTGSLSIVQEGQSLNIFGAHSPVDCNHSILPYGLTPHIAPISANIFCLGWTITDLFCQINSYLDFEFNSTQISISILSTQSVPMTFLALPVLHL